MLLPGQHLRVGRRDAQAVEQTRGTHQTPLPSVHHELPTARLLQARILQRPALSKYLLHRILQ